MALRALQLALLVTAGACAVPGVPPPPQADPLRRPAPRRVEVFAPATVGTIVLMGVEFPSAGLVGGHFEGIQYQRQVADIEMTEAARRSWSLSVAQRVAARLRLNGFTVEQGAVPTSYPVPLEAVRFGLHGQVQDLSVRSVGATGPHRIEVSAQVAWELLDLAAGSPIYGYRASGRSEARDSVTAAVTAAVESSLTPLLSDSGFRRALAAPRPMGLDELVGAPFAPRPAPGSSELITLTRGDLNVPEGLTRVEQLAAAVVTLRGARRPDETAFLLTRDGLALTSHRAVQTSRRLWARFFTGVERPVRVLRSDRRAGVALLQISCPDPCATVRWTTAPGVAGTAVVVMGAPFGANPGYLVAQGTTRGRLGSVHGSRFTLDIESDLSGGELVARGRDGAVFAIGLYTSQRRSYPPARSLEDAFRALNLRADSIPDR